VKTMTTFERSVNDMNVYEKIDHFQRNPNDELVKEAIVLQYENLVYSIARNYATDRMNWEDLCQVGMIGLIYAAQRYDKQYGNSFKSFAIPTIRGEIKRYIRDKTWSVHVPRRVKELGPKIKKATDELTKQLQRLPNVTEIAEYLNVSESELIEAKKMTDNYNSLSVDYKYKQMSDNNLYTLLDIVGKKEHYFERVEIKLLLEDIFATLTVREQQVLKYIFYERLTQSEVGELLNISQMHVSRIQRGALNKLKEELYESKQKINEIK